MAALPEQLATEIRRRKLLAPGERVVLAVSGGADSVAMLAAFAELAGRRAWRWTLHVGHLNHGLRAEDADNDARFVTGLAERLEVPATVERIDVPETAAREGGSIEEVARRVRYGFLARLAARLGAQAVATAHTAEDNAETVLHRICRGTGLDGLGGIRPSRPIAPGSPVRLIRPLLRLRRDVLRVYLRECGQAWREDASNLDVAATRNRIRREVLPLLAERLNPRVVDALCRLAEAARTAHDGAATAAAGALAALTRARSADRIDLDAAGLRRLSEGLATEVIRSALHAIGAPFGGVTATHLSAIASMTVRGEGGKSLDLPDRVHAALGRGVLTLSCDGRRVQ